LIAAGVDAAKVNTPTDSLRNTALHQAVIVGRHDIVQLLLERGAEIDAPNKYGQTALYQAAIVGLHDMVQLLLEKGAEVDAPNKYGETALHRAAFYGYDDIVRLLLGYGADCTDIDERWRQLWLPIGQHRRYEPPLPPYLRLWEMATLGTTYDSLDALCRDTDVDVTELPLQLVTYDWELPAVLKSVDGLAYEDYKTYLEKLVVLVAGKSTVGRERAWDTLKATTCIQYLENQWNTVGTELLRDIIRCLKDIAAAELQICKNLLSNRAPWRNGTMLRSLSYLSSPT
jgi:hypothetical protein